jgi:hypothetical protein
MGRFMGEAIVEGGVELVTGGKCLRRFHPREPVSSAIRLRIARTSPLLAAIVGDCSLLHLLARDVERRERHLEGTEATAPNRLSSAPWADFDTAAGDVELPRRGGAFSARWRRGVAGGVAREPDPLHRLSADHVAMVPLRSSQNGAPPPADFYTIHDFRVPPPHFTPPRARRRTFRARS